MMPAPKEERRASSRVHVHCPIYYFYFAPSVNRPVTRALDLSENGALLEALDPLRPGTAVAFQMITSEQKVADVRAQVVHLHLREDHTYRVGVRFTHLADSDRAILERELHHVAP